jgi:hypothetical protein
VAEDLDKTLSEIWYSDNQGWNYKWPNKEKAKKEKRL